MIPLLFQTPLPWLINWLPGQFADLDQPDVTVERVTPKVRPRKFILLFGDGGDRLREVHKAYTVRAQLWATFEGGQTDWDTLERMSTQFEYLMGVAAKTSPHIATLLSFNGPSPVIDPNGVEYRYATADLQLRGVPA